MKAYKIFAAVTGKYERTQAVESQAVGHACSTFDLDIV